MIKTTLKVEDKEFKALMARISKRATDLRRPYILVARRLLAEFGLTFRTKTEPGGRSWPDYKSKILYRGRGGARKAVIPRRAMLLLDTGDLRKSLNIMRPAVWKVGRYEIVFGTDIPYAIYHHSDAPRKRLPRRRFMDWIPLKHDKMLVRVVEQYIFGKGML